MKQHAFVCDIKGRGGHGAMPDTAIDPVMAAAALIHSADARLPPGVSVNWHSVQGGTRFNIIPENISVSGSLLVCETDADTAKSARENTGAQVMSAFRTEGVLHFTGEVPDWT